MQGKHLCLDQIISNMRNEFDKYINEYLKIILNIIEEKNANRKLKISIVWK